MPPADPPPSRPPAGRSAAPVTVRPPAPRSGGVASPCSGVCRMDAATGWCAGCLRTLDEIAAWGMLDDEGRRAVLQRLPARRVAWRDRAHDTPPPPRPPAGR